MIFSLVSILIFLAYTVLILSITIGWWKLKIFKNIGLFPETTVSIIVAVRNESANIDKLLHSLFQQDYPSHLLEITIVDDHSLDSTSSIVKEFIAQLKGLPHQLELISLDKENDGGKKAAINRGIQQSKGELIVITDADCTAGISWISKIVTYYEEYKPQMILGPVRMNDSGRFFGKLQSLEFMSLISSAAGACNAEFPILANGANIAFTRHAYESCGGFSGNMQFPSGDDMFMMMNIKKRFGARAIRFIKSPEAIINTNSATSLRSFIQQRKRWVSKSRGYTDPFLIAASITVMLVNVWLVLTAFTSVFFPENLALFLIMYLVKLLVDLPLLLSFSRFQRSLPLVWLLPLMELMNAVYTFYIGIAGNIGRYEWKGRKLTTKERG